LFTRGVRDLDRIVRGLVAAVLVGATGSSAADAPAADAPPVASDYVARSWSVFGAGELTPLPTTSGALGLAAGARLHYRHLAIEARLGGAFAFTAIANGGVFAARAGVSAGIALPVGCRVALIPMLAYDAFLLDQPSGDAIVVHRATLELPVTILLFRHVAIEPFVQAGLAWISGGRDIAVVAGPRISIVL
jgi:hypothetical protein